MNDVLRVLRKTESRLEKQMKATDAELSKVRATIKLWAGKAIGKVRKRRRMSAATRRKMAASARKRWAAKKAQ